MSSLKRRVGVGMAQLARSVAAEYQGNLDKAMAEIGSNPAVALRALDRYTSTFVGPDVEARLGDLLSTRTQKLKETFAQALAKIGDSGVYDKIVAQADDLGAKLLGHLDSDAWREQAARISGSLARVLDGIGKAITSFLARITHTTGGADTVGAVVELAAKAMERLARVADDLPKLGTAVGAFFGSLGGTIDAAIGKVDELVAAIRNFSLSQGVLDPNAMSYLKDGGLSLSEKRARAAVAVAEKYGIAGGQVRKVDLAPMDHKPGSADELFSRDTLDFLVTMGRHRLAGDDADTAARKATDYVKRSAFEVDPGAVADPQQKALMARVASVLADLDEDQLRPGRANVEILTALRSAGVLAKLEALKPGVAPAAAAAQAPAVPAAVQALSLRDQSVPPAGIPQSVFDLARTEYVGPNFRARSKAIGSLIGQVEAAPDRDGHADLVRVGNGVFSGSLNGDPDNPLRIDGALARMRHQYEDAMGKLGLALADGQAAMAAGGKKQLADLLKGLGDTRGRVEAGYKDAMVEVSDGLREAAKSYGLRLADTLDDVPAFASRTLLDRVSRGATSFADRAAAVAAKSGLQFDRAVVGLAGLPVADQLRLARRMTDVGVKSVEDQGTFGKLDLGMDAARVADAFRRLRIDDRDVDQGKLAFLRAEAVPRQQQVLAAALNKYREDPGELNARNLGAAEAELARLVELSGQLERKTDDLGAAFQELGGSARQSVEAGLGGAGR